MAYGVGSAEPAQDFEDSGHDLDVTADLVSYVYDLELGERMSVVRVGVDYKDGYTAGAATAKSLVIGWHQELKENYPNMSAHEIVGTITTCLNNLAEKRSEQGEIGVVKELGSSREEAVNKINSMIAKTGCTKDQFNKFLSSNYDLQQVGDFSKGEPAENLISNFGIMKGQAKASGFCEMIARQNGSRMSAEDMRTFADKGARYVDMQPQKERMQKVVNRVTKQNVYGKSMNDLETSVGLLEKARNSDRKAALDALQGMSKTRLAIAVNQFEQQQKVAQKDIDRMINKPNAMAIRRAVKGIERKSQKTKIENFWNSKKGRDMKKNLFYQAASVSLATRKIHNDKVRSKAPTREDLGNAKKVVDRMIESGSTSQAVAWKEVTNLIDKVTKDREAKTGQKLKTPRIGEVYTKIHGIKMTGKEIKKGFSLKQDQRTDIQKAKDAKVLDKAIKESGLTTYDANQQIQDKDRKVVKDVAEQEILKKNDVDPQDVEPNVTDKDRAVTKEIFDKEIKGSMDVKNEGVENNIDQDLKSEKANIDNEIATENGFYDKHYPEAEEQVDKEDQEKHDEAEKKPEQEPEQKQKRDQDQGKDRGKDNDSDLDITD